MDTLASVKRIFVVDEMVTAKNIEPLHGNTVAPPLEMNKRYAVKGITLDKEGNQHLDVGLKSIYTYIQSHETKEDLPDGNKIHWCHPSRFI